MLRSLAGACALHTAGGARPATCKLAFCIPICIPLNNTLRGRPRVQARVSHRGGEGARHTGFRRGARCVCHTNTPPPSSSSSSSSLPSAHSHCQQTRQSKEDSLSHSLAASRTYAAKPRFGTCAFAKKKQKHAMKRKEGEEEEGARGGRKVRV